MGAPPSPPRVVASAVAHDLAAGLLDDRSFGKPGGSVAGSSALPPSGMAVDDRIITEETKAGSTTCPNHGVSAQLPGDLSNGGADGKQADPQPYKFQPFPASNEGSEAGKSSLSWRNAPSGGNQGVNTQACPSNGRPISSSHQKQKPHRTAWMNVGHMKAWFGGGDILGSISRTCREKKKEELRLHMAQVHAALSVAQLAAAVAGVVAADGSPHQQLVISSSNDQQAPSLDGKMSAVVASAAALVATVCAEAAEMAGASRAHIAAAISSGLAAQTPADVLTLTATAATCLRGAATLELRANSTCGSHVQEEGRQMLAKGAELPIRIALGKIHIRMVCVYTKHDKLMLRLGKKYLQGALTTYKEYRIIKAELEETKDMIRDEIYGFCLLVLGTTEGTIGVLFDDERQRKIWKSSISHLLCDQEMRLISSPKFI